MGAETRQGGREMHNSRHRVLGAVALAACLISAAAGAADTVAFGSCLRQWKPAPIWRSVLASGPDLFILSGDAVYADGGLNRFAPEPERIARAYRSLSERTGFQALRAQVPVYATWDDHDYGLDNAGAEYPWKEVSERLFLDFFDVPDSAPERGRPGVYSSRVLGEPGRRIQLILLDTRYFRSPTLRGDDGDCPGGGYEPNRDPQATLLGDDQWQWLAGRLREPAELRILVSSIQVISDRHCFEKWANFPLERGRLFELIGETGASGLVLVSGDRHFAEISRLVDSAAGYPLYEVTASGLNTSRRPRGDEDNPYRVSGSAYGGENFGLIRVDWDAEAPRVHLEVHGLDGGTVREVELPLSLLAAP
jgi:alkaline phosphatase D